MTTANSLTTPTYSALTVTAQRRRQSQTQSTQVLAAPTSQCQRKTATNVSSGSTDIQGANWTCWTTLNQLRHSGCTNRRPSLPPPLPRPLRRQLILTVLLNDHIHPSSSFSSPSSSSSSSSSSTTPTFAVVVSVKHINITHNPDTPENTKRTTVDVSGVDPAYTCPHCDRTFTSHIGWSVTCEIIAQ
nr:unnamed protein product [Spirometra erinaceieuropaei]